MPSEIKEFFTAAKALTPKVACVENHLINAYHKFLKQQNIVFACIGKPNSDKRHNFEKRTMLNENKKTINAYNNSLKTLNEKNKQFEQYFFNDFLE